MSTSAAPSPRDHPDYPGLTATFRHVNGWQALSITGSPQTMELVVTNRTAQTVRAGPGVLWLSFRPGILDALDEVRLAPESEAAWALGFSEIPEAVVLSLAGVDVFDLAPGLSFTLRIDGMSAAAAGGSRASRVEFSYANFLHFDGTEISGTRLLPLPVLRRHEPVGLPQSKLRTGSTAENGPFVAGFQDGGDILNDSNSANTLTLRIANMSGGPLALSHLDDEATRLHLSYKTGDEAAPWGLVREVGDHLGIETVPPGWDFNHHTIHRTGSGSWRPRETMDISLRIHSGAPSGQTQLIVTYENLPEHDDGELVLLVNLGGIAERNHRIDLVKRLALRGENAVLQFEPGDVEGREIVTPPTIRAAGGTHTAGRLDIAAPHGIDVDGRLARHYNIARTVQKFTLGGERLKFYPVVIADEDWSHGMMKLEFFRSHTHTDKQWLGSMMAQIECHSSNWGHGSDFWSIKIRQSGANDARNSRLGISYRSFVGGFTTHRTHAAQVIWLEGNATYSWVANHPARIVNLAILERPGEVRYPDENNSATQVFPVKSSPDKGYAEPFVSIERSMGQDTHPVPRGSIIMWSGSADNIPLGWALCDGGGEGEDKRPDLTDRFVMGAGRTNANTGAEADTHTHSIDPPKTGTNPAGDHTHDFPSSWYKRAFDDGGFSGIDTGGANVSNQTVQESGEHSHWVDIARFTSGKQSPEATKNRPRWWALCFIIRL